MIDSLPLYSATQSTWPATPISFEYRYSSKQLMLSILEKLTAPDGWCSSGLRANDIYSIEKVLEPRYMGNVNAPIKFTEFVSFTCSHCADFHINKLPSIKEKYIDKGLLRLELRDFPLDGLALRAAAMSRLVDQNKYYKFVEMLFNKQKNWSQSNDPIKELKKLGRLTGLKKELLDAYINSS